MSKQERATMQEITRNDRLWPRIRPWAAASLAGILTTIFICLVEIAYPRAILDLHHYLLVHIWPANEPFRGGYARAGGPFLAFVATFMAMSVRNDVELDSIKDFAAHFVLSKSFAGICLVPQVILFATINAKAGWYGWSSLFGTQGFDTPLFVNQMQNFCFFPLQSVAFGVIAYGIKRDRAALLTTGIGGLTSLLLYLPAFLAGVSGFGLAPFHLDVSVP